MFRNVFVSEAQKPYFEEVDGPWIDDGYFASFILPVDLEGGSSSSNNKYDLIVGDEKGLTRIYHQDRSTGVWTQLTIRNAIHNKYWLDACLMDYDQDGLQDLVVAWEKKI